MRSLLLLLVLALAACKGPGHVEFSGGKCLIDGNAANVSEVETAQATISERIVSRQPLFVLVTIIIVALAGASHLEKVVLLFSAREKNAHGLSQRLQLALDRQRDRPMRYFSIVVSTLLLIGIAAGFYVYLDADKRASERALGLLQFCHIAMRNGEAEGILAEQRNNLQAIESTAGNIRALVDKLPPAEQAKAKEIVEQINVALSRQGKLVNDYMTQTNDASKTMMEHTALLEKGITSLQTNLTTLKSVPQSLHDVADELHALDGKAATTDAKLAALKATIDQVAARPELKCPACVCEPPKPATAKPDAGARQ
jgi:type II secretory pathway component PulM